MPPKILRLRSLGDLVSAVREACTEGGDAHGPPAATVVVHARLAHRVRAAAGPLAGALFRTAAQCAEAVLLGRGLARRGGAEHFGPLAVEAVLAAVHLPRPLRYFRLEQLQAGAGYAEAIARALDELAWAGFSPEDLDRAASRARERRAGRLADLATLWRALRDFAAAGTERTTADLLDEAAGLLRRHLEAWPFPGPTLAWVTEETPGAVCRFLGTVPDLRVAYLPAFPVRAETRRRLLLVARALGASPRALTDPAPGRGPQGSRRGGGGRAPMELDLLKSWLLHPPPGAREVRPASAGPDGTVILEEHAGIEEELAAAVDWVSVQVLDRGRALEEVALLVPALDPLAGMLVERLSGLPWEAGALDGAEPAHVAPRGLPAAASAPGARLVALLECLRADVSAASLARLAPTIRLDPASGGRGRLSHADATEAVWSCGTLGGLAGRPEGASEWPGAITRRADDLDARIARIAPGAPDEPEKVGAARAARGRPALERLRDALRGLAPAITELVSVHELVRAGRPIAEIWPRLRGFAVAHISPGGPDLLPRLGEALAPFLRSRFSAEATGARALRMLREELDRLRVPKGRFGEPRLFVGTIGAAAGLPFAAVRVLGLAEGAFPTRATVDPILPDEDRERLDDRAGGRAAPRREEWPVLELRALHRVVQGVSEEVVFSFARQGLDGVVREPSGILLEVAAALRRPVGGRPTPVPTLSDLRRAYFLSEDARTAAPSSPLTERGRADAVASRAEAGSAAIPGAWLGGGRPALDLGRLRALAVAGGPGAADGLLGPTPARPGLDPSAPLSASRIQTLLECPHRFLLAHVLAYEEPAEPPDTRRIGQPDYGSLVHQVLERFGDAHGEPFTQRKDDLAAWRRRAEVIADAALAEFLRAYPLLDGPVRAQERERVLRDVGQFLANEWDRRPGLRYLAVEREFGYPDPVALALGEGLTLHVHGYMDRLDRVGPGGEGLLIRDYKTGHAHPRAGKEADPVPEVDVQLAVYGLAAEALRAAGRAPWGPLAGLAYVYPEPRDEAERAWEGTDLARLLEAGRGWLRLAARLVGAGAFPRTPREEDCRFCPFRPVCGPGAQAEAAGRLAGLPSPVADFLALKAGPEEAADE